jgi:hypothetical protein
MIAQEPVDRLKRVELVAPARAVFDDDLLAV